MRTLLAKRIFQNEADASPGNGAPVAAAAQPAPTAAPTAPAPTPTLSAEQITDLMAKQFESMQNAFFANARKAGLLKQDKPASEAPTQTTQPTPSAPSAQAGLSMSDVEALLERERVIASRAAKHGLTEAQTRRLQGALSGVSRESLATEADSYLADLGLVKAPTPAPAPAAAPAPAPSTPAKPNISDRGTAAPTDLRDSEGVLHSRPLEMTAHDVDALILKHGQTKGLQMFQERVLSALRGVRVKPRG